MRGLCGPLHLFALFSIFFHIVATLPPSSNPPPTHPLRSGSRSPTPGIRTGQLSMAGGIAEGRNLKPRLSAYTWKHHPAHLLSLFAPHFSFSAFMVDPPQTCNAGWFVIEGAGLRLPPSAFRPLRAAVCSCRGRNSDPSTCRPGTGSEVGGGRCLTGAVRQQCKRRLVKN